MDQAKKLQKKRKPAVQRATPEKSPREKAPETRPATRSGKPLSAFYASGPAHPLAAPGARQATPATAPGGQRAGKAVQEKGVALGRRGDRYEREADAVADHAVRGQAAPEVSHLPPGGLAQRQADEPDVQEMAKEEEPVQPKTAEKPVQEQAEDETAQEQAEDETAQEQAEDETAQEQAEDETAQEQTEDEPVQQQAEDETAQKQPDEEPAVQEKTTAPTRRERKKTVAARAIRNRGAGEPLAPETRAKLEKSLGNDLSGVRVHQGGPARTAARDMRARAFTHKNHIWLGPGESARNVQLMAHEVAHVLQQGGVARRRSGRTAPRTAKNAKKERDEKDEPAVQPTVEPNVQLQDDTAREAGTPVYDYGSVKEWAGANLRDKALPGKQSTILKRLRPWTVVFVERELPGSWYAVSTKDGQRGYVARWLLEVGIPVSTRGREGVRKYGVVKNSRGALFFKQPAVFGEPVQILGTLKSGTRFYAPMAFTTLEGEGSVRALLEDGRQGFLAKDDVKLDIDPRLLLSIFGQEINRYGKIAQGRTATLVAGPAMKPVTSLSAGTRLLIESRLAKIGPGGEDMLTADVSGWPGLVRAADVDLGYDVAAPAKGVGKEVGTLGLVSHATGVNFRDKPSLDGTLIARLPLSTRLFVVKELEPTAPAGGGRKWYYVVVQGDDLSARRDAGYVAADHVETNLPEPTARLHLIKPGESPIGIAERYYKGKVKWGRDLRFYVNVLVYVNQAFHRSGISSSGSTSNLFSWYRAKTTAGEVIWIPSPRFADTLIGKISSGSLSHEAVEVIKDIGAAIVAAGEYVVAGAAFLGGLLVGIGNNLIDLLSGLIDLLGAALDTIKSLIQGTILNDLRGLFDAVKNLTFDDFLGMPLLGDISFKDIKLKWSSGGLWGRWYFRGKVIGYLVAEVVLAILTAGGGTLAKVLGKGGKLAKLAKKLPALRRLEKAAEAKNLGRFSKTVGDKIPGRKPPKKPKLEPKLKPKPKSTAPSTRKPKKKAPKKKKPEPKKKKKPESKKKKEQRRQWALFVKAVRKKVKQYKKTGVKKKDLKKAIKAIARKHKKGLARWRPTAIDEPKKKGFWIVKAKKRGGLRRKKVGEALMHRDDKRWKKARQAIIERVKKIKAKKRTKRDIERLIKKFKKPFRYSSLDVVFDKKEEDFDIMGAMSKKKKVAEVPGGDWPTGEADDPIPIIWWKKIANYPKLKFHDFGSGPGSRTLVTMRHNEKKKIPTHGKELGVDASNIPTAGTTVWKKPNLSERKTKMETRLKNALKHLTGLKIKVPGGKTFVGAKDVDEWAIDHVRDFKWGGADTEGNAWPLDWERNAKANATNNQYVRVRKDGVETDQQVSRLKGRNFFIKKIKDGGELASSGDHGTGPGNPVNGTSDVPLRKSGRGTKPPTGESETEAIPIVWYKDSAKLPTIEFRANMGYESKAKTVYKPASAGKIPTHGKALGVADANIPKAGRTVWQKPDVKRNTSMEKTLKDAIKILPGLEIEGKAETYRRDEADEKKWSVDHVKDAKWGGLDKEDNLWPLGSKRNLLANAVHFQYVRFSEEKDGEVTVVTKQVSHAKGKYFYVHAIEDPKDAGMTDNGRNGSDRDTPVNSGKKHSLAKVKVPKRKPGSGGS